jgi:hypothetical protein
MISQFLGNIFLLLLGSLLTATALHIEVSSGGGNLSSPLLYGILYEVYSLLTVCNSRFFGD